MTGQCSLIGQGWADEKDRAAVVDVWAPEVDDLVANMFGRRFADLIGDMADGLDVADREILLAAINRHADWEYNREI